MSADRPGAPSLESVLNEVRACTACLGSLPLGPRPLVQASPSATILIIGQAPGAKAHHSGVPFSDESGERLREWTGLSVEHFYNEELVAIIPMGFCYPGRLGGGDAPPRRECARLWHDRVLALLPQVDLTLLLGAHAQNHLLGPAQVAQRVRNFRDYLPRHFPLPHPSWRSRLWEQKNPWFRDEVIPALRVAIERIRQGAGRPTSADGTSVQGK